MSKVVHSVVVQSVHDVNDKYGCPADWCQAEGDESFATISQQIMLRDRQVI